MRNGNRSRFLGVVYEIALSVLFFTNNLNGVLVCAHSAIRAQPIKHGADDVIWFSRKILIHRKTGMGDIVHNTHSEMVFGCSLSKVVINRFDHSRSEILGGQTVASTYNNGHPMSQVLASVG
ncbi:hypothetical protein SDC9_204571 [bioreactor metagenome]|uniref:Uncharacterized protein n=1 Tax=bioreactor metagenome TaxID=1076179 RepID=A0A645IZM4_9ZZZZ